MLTVNFQSRTPVYQQLYDEVIRLVSVGTLKVDSKLPTVRSLAMELGINPNTVAKAYKMLEADGYIYSTVGRGSFISENLGQSDASKIKAKEELAANIEKAMKQGITQEEIYYVVKRVVEGKSSSDIGGEIK